MALTQRLDLRQSQTLVMTPQMQQAIKLLQFSNLELTAFVTEEVERNPLLDWEGEDGGERGQEPTRGDSPAQVGDEARPGSDALELDRLTETEILPDPAAAPLDAEPADLYDSTPQDQLLAAEADAGPEGWASHGGLTGRGQAPGEEGPALEERLAQPESLRDHLLAQLNLELQDPQLRLIAVYLLDQLDEWGYLRADLEACAADLACPLAQLEAVLGVLQGLEPTGIFARSLEECLALQLAERDRLDPAMRRLLQNLPLLARRDFAALRRICGVDEEDLVDMIAEIKRLNPKPADSFLSPPAAPVVPDIFLRATAQGGWHLELNSESLPRVLVNRRYQASLTRHLQSRDDRDYVAGQIQSANWLVRALEQRATTILKVARDIVRRQDGFFRRGVQHLRPLTLREVAEEVELHESTVSRATAGKYIDTPRGIFELKYFFTTALAGADGESHSAEAVRHRIRELIAAETAKTVLSDDSIVAILQRDGIDIARRTVAKYRESMHIPASFQRRREKALEAGHP